MRVVKIDEGKLGKGKFERVYIDEVRAQLEPSPGHSLHYYNGNSRP